MNIIQNITKAISLNFSSSTRCFSVIKDVPPLGGTITNSEHFVKSEIQYAPSYQQLREVWVENLDSIEQINRGLINLHPEIFGVLPRIDIVHQNVVWQRLYRYVNHAVAKTRAEVRGGGRKPWPQKGTGRARQGSIRSPQWVGGGRCHGPRGPETHFYMLEFNKRIRGLTSVLSGKLAQDDIHIVDSLEIPTDNPEYLQQIIADRHWGLSVLFVDDTDIMPRNITAASDEMKHITLMPAYGLNVFSMLKHETLVLTLDAVNKIQDQLLGHLHQNRPVDKKQLVL